MEPEKGFTVTPSNASSGLMIGTATANGTIRDDDKSTALIAALSADEAEGNGGTTSFTFTVSLDQTGVGTQSVNWSVSGLAAQSADASDFGGSLPAGTVTFVAGETSKSIAIGVAGDSWWRLTRRSP